MPQNPDCQIVLSKSELSSWPLFPNVKYCILIFRKHLRIEEVLTAFLLFIVMWVQSASIVFEWQVAWLMLTPQFV